MSAWDVPPRARFHGRHRFTLAPGGRTAEASYRSLITASRKQPGRSAFDAARTAWACAMNLQPDDGVYLGELRSGPATLAELTSALDVCGKTRADAVTALGRLVDAGLVEPAPTDAAAGK